MIDLNNPTYLVFFAIVYFVVLYYVIYKTITGGTKSNTTFLSILYLFVFFVPIIFIYSKLGINIFSTAERFSLTPKTIVYFIFSIAAIYGIFYIMGNLSYFIGAGTSILGFAIFIVGLSIIYSLTKKYVLPGKNPVILWLKFLFKFLFYIPCLVVDFVEYINHQLEITPNTVVSLLIIEVCLLLILHYYPSFVKNVVINDGKLIVNEPLYLNVKQMVATVPEIFPKTDIKTNAVLSQKIPLNAGSQNLTNAQVYQQKLVGDYCTKNPNSSYCVNLKYDSTDPSFNAILNMRNLGRATNENGVVSTVKCTDVFEQSGAGYSSITGCLLDQYDTTYLSSSQLDSQQKMKNTYLRNYSLAMWIFINPQPPTTVPYIKPTNIFRIGDQYTTRNLSAGKPMVTYFVDTDPNSDISIGKYRFYLSDDPITADAGATVEATTDADGDPTYYDLRAPEQKWNLFVFNFSESVDIFLNGDLVITKKTNTSVPYNTDSFIVGEDSGLDGAICSLVWFPHTLTNQQIKNYYNSMKNLNPPVIEIKK